MHGQIQKHVLGISASEKHEMTVLTPRAKRDLPKNTPSALVVVERYQIVQNDEENNFSSDDEHEASTHNTVLD